MTGPSSRGAGYRSQELTARAVLLLAASLPLLALFPAPTEGQQGGPGSAPTWVDDVGPIMAAACMNCHRPDQGAPMPLLTYEDARTWAPSIRMMVEERIMPLGAEDPLNAEQVRKLLEWIEAGAPRGEGTFTPPEFTHAPDPSLFPGELGHYNHELALRAIARRAGGPISIDGFLDEPVWSDAFPVTNFRQTAPVEGQQASERTEVFFAYDDDAIYVGANLSDRNPVTTRLARRDAGLADSDVLVVLIDSYHDHETAYRFWTNPSGARGDAIVTGNRTGGGDSSWDPVWDVATRVSESGWFAEMRIPFSQLRFTGDPSQVWGVQVERNINRNQENAAFPFTPTLERGGVSRFAHLDGIESIEPGRRLELLPYLVMRGEYLQPARPDGVDFPNPYQSRSEHSGTVGMDLKYRLNPSVTLDGTVNPDFGQVELDPSVINLTAFETRYEERRPFFVEGAGIFTLGEEGPTGTVGSGPQIVYSRRIGRPPRGSVPSGAAFSDIPAATTIAGAAKLTGQVGGGWSLGVLEAVTAREVAPYVEVDRLPHEMTVEPPANYFAGRVRRQAAGGRTRFGAIASAVNRSSAGALADRLHSSAYSTGVDFAHETEDRRWLFSGLVSGSHVRGTPEAILRTQRSSLRYYQRPDASHLEISADATSLSGLYAMGYVGKQSGNFTLRTGVAAVSPGYEVNDLGFHTAADRVLLDTQFRYTQPDTGRVLRSWRLNLGGPDAIWNFAGDRTLTNINGSITLQFLNYWSTVLSTQYEPWVDDDRLTRGGPMARSPSSNRTTLRVNSDDRRAAVGWADYRWGSDAAGGWEKRLRFNLSARFEERVQLSLAPSYTWSYDAAQYVTRVSDPLAEATYGTRYVFAGLDRTTLSVQTRVNLTFSPTLSFELYVEPFISTGDYGTLKEFQAPETYKFVEYGKDMGTLVALGEGRFDVDPDGAGPAASFRVSNEDFSYRSLLGNAVVRWEWRPGSTVFFVWQQTRINSIAGEGVGRFDLAGDTQDMFGVRPDNIFMIKVSYWLNP